MSTPFDVINHILPYLKALIAWNLAKRGVGQRQIAKALGTSQALISKYISKPPQYYLDELKRLGISSEELESVIDIVSNYVVSSRIEDARSYLTVYIFTLLKRCVLCKTHRSISKGLENCRICEHLNLSLDDDIIARVKYAINLIESIPDVELIVPEVGMNIVEAKPNAKSIYEVVGIPGRMIKVSGKVKAVSQPTYGGSRFMASLIIRVMKYFPNIRSAINIKYSPLLEGILEKMGFKVVRLETYDSRTINTVLDLIEKSLSSSPETPDAIIDQGPPGFEHLIYLLAEDSVKLASKVNTVVIHLRGHRQ